MDGYLFHSQSLKVSLISPATDDALLCDVNFVSVKARKQLHQTEGYILMKSYLRINISMKNSNNPLPLLW